MNKYEGHTPGPWVVDNPNFELIAKMSGGIYHYIARCDPREFSRTNRTSAENRANARLIADAPMLLEQRDRLLKALKILSTGYKVIMEEYEYEGEGVNMFGLHHASCALISEIEKGE
jgi:hypothetical protein